MNHDRTISTQYWRAVMGPPCAIHPERGPTAASTPDFEPATDRDVVSTRVFDAPRERVFQAWTDPNHLMHWWGPQGFTHTFHEFDPRPGGVWRFVMHGPDGTDHENQSVFVEVLKPQRIVFDHVSGHKFQATVVFAEEGGKTRVTWRMRFESAAEFLRVKGVVVEANEQNLGRLEAQLAKMA